MKFKNLTLRLHSGQAGFTLIELIIVIAVIALLAAATFVAVNPAKRIGDANNAQRWSDVTAMADAWTLYLADNSGTAASTTITDGVTYTIATTTGGTFSADACTVTTTTALASLDTLVTSGYIGQIPIDPEMTSPIDRTDYYFYTDSTGIIKIGACEVYNSVDIEVTR
jgi:prepilin-type N-terminal cleavage/methylation domain-containing protein